MNQLTKKGRCPLCYSTLITHSKSEQTPIRGYAEVEHNQVCPLGCFQHRWSYGLTEVFVKGERVVVFQSHYLTSNQIQRYVQSVQRVLQVERQKREKFIRLMVRKKKSQTNRNKR